MTNVNQETRADMFKRGFVYLRRGSQGGLRKVVTTPYIYEDHELIFDTAAYEKETGQ